MTKQELIELAKTMGFNNESTLDNIKDFLDECNMQIMFSEKGYFVTLKED